MVPDQSVLKKLHNLSGGEGKKLTPMIRVEYSEAAILGMFCLM